MNNRLSDEIQSNREIWKDGYYEGDPLSPLSNSHYKQIGFISVLHATYLRCIKPYITPDTIALELGPGKGAWTKALLPSREVWALDARSAEDNGFFEYLDYPENVRYFEVSDFECQMLPENTFDYMFSFGCLCHVSFEGIQQYAVNLFPKMKPGSECFWMVADYDKFNEVVQNIDHYSIWNASVPRSASRKLMPQRVLFNYLRESEIRRAANQHTRVPKTPDKDQKPRPARWFHSGINQTCAMLEETGYEVVDPDVGTCLRDPVIHFRKP